MKTFKQYISEGFREEAVPAIKGLDGKIYRGKRGDDHIEVREKHMKEPGKPLEGESGYYHRKTGFVSKKEMGGLDSRRMLTPDEREAKEKQTGFSDIDDAPSLMSNAQRMRRYGTFE